LIWFQCSVDQLLLWGLEANSLVVFGSLGRHRFNLGNRSQSSLLTFAWVLCRCTRSPWAYWRSLVSDVWYRHRLAEFEVLRKLALFAHIEADWGVFLGCWLQLIEFDQLDHCLGHNFQDRTLLPIEWKWLAFYFWLEHSRLETWTHSVLAGLVPHTPSSSFWLYVRGLWRPRWVLRLGIWTGWPAQSRYHLFAEFWWFFPRWSKTLFSLHLSLTHNY